MVANSLQVYKFRAVENIPYIGEIFSFLCALIWGFAVIFFKKSGETVHPVALNLFKNSFAALLYIPTMLILGQSLLFDADAETYFVLFASGVLGIGIADTLFLTSLNMLGASLYAVISCFYSPAVILLSVIWLGERLSLWQIFGTLLIISAVINVSFAPRELKLEKRKLFIGIILGIVSQVLMAIGIVWAKEFLEKTPVLWASDVRLLGGIFFLALYLLFLPKRKEIVSSLLATKSWKYTFAGAFTGTYVAILLWIAGMKYANASIAAALNQTSNIFLFVLASIFLHEKMTLRKIVSIAIAIVGVLLVTFL